MLDIGLACGEQRRDLAFAGNNQPQPVRKRCEIAVDEVEDRRGCAMDIDIGVLLQ